MRLAFVSPDVSSGPYATGIGNYTAAIASGLRARGHEVHLLSRAWHEDRVGTLDDGVHLHLIGPPRPRLPELFGPVGLTDLIVRGAWTEIAYRRHLARRLEELVAAGEVELIEAADAQAEAAFYRSRKHPQVPLVVRLHAPLSLGERFERNLPAVARGFVWVYERAFLLGASHLTAPTRHAASLIRSSMRLGARPIQVHPNPPSFESIGASEVDQPEPAHVLFVGRLGAAKGADLVVGAIPHVLERYPDATFTLAGGAHVDPRVDQTMRESLLSPLTPAQLASVTAPGYLSPEQVERCYRRASVVVLPSRFETFGYTCIEAMAHGKAIIGARQTATGELLGGGDSGLVIDNNEPGALGTAIVRLLEDDSLRSTLEANARARFSAVYARSVVLDACERFYRQALQDAK